MDDVQDSYTAELCQLSHLFRCPRMLTRLGQKVAILWMDTNPTKRETGKSQNMVKALMDYTVRHC